MFFFIPTMEYSEEIPKGATEKQQRIGLTTKLGLEIMALESPEESKKESKELVIPSSAIAQFTPFAPPHTPLETALAEIWCEVLKVEQVNLEDNFFDLGGDSLLATQVINRVRSHLNLDLSIFDLWEDHTLKALAAELTRNTSLPSSLPQKSIQPSPHPNTSKNFPLSFAQTRMWILEQLSPQSSAYNQTLAIRLPKSVDVAVLERALQEIIRRHDGLRSRFFSLEGQPRQEISPAFTLGLSVIDVNGRSSIGSQYDSNSCHAAQDLAGEYAQIPFDLSQGGLIRGTIFKFGSTTLTDHSSAILSDQSSTSLPKKDSATPSDRSSTSLPEKDSATLTEEDSETQILILVMHHIISDGWSVGVLLQELNALYPAFLQGLSSPLPELPIQYPDFALWQQQEPEDVLENHLAFWKKHLEGAPPVLELPIDRPRPLWQTFPGAMETQVLPLPLREALKTMSRQENVTLFTTLLAAFATLLHRYTGATDIVIGCPIAGRNLLETENLIGVFINTLALRIRFEDNPSFQDLLQQVREVSHLALAHQAMPLEKIIEELQSERNSSHPPLFQVMFVAKPPMPELEFRLDRSFPVHNGTTKFDLSLEIEETSAGIFTNIEYSTDLFDRSTITRMLGHFQVLLTSLVANPEQQVSDLPLLTSAEKQLFQLWNNTQKEFPQDQSIQQLFEAQVEKTPEAIAAVWQDQSLTYRELNARSNRLAHYLQARGVEPDMLVGICVDRSLEMIIGLLGILKAGGAYVPMDPIYPIARLSSMIEDAQISILLTQQHLVDPVINQLPEHQAQIICLDSNAQVFADHSPENPVTPLKSTNLAYVIYTSGSTGNPKGVLIEHRSAVNFIHASLEEYQLSPCDKILQFAAFGFDAAVEEIYPALSCGATIVLRNNEMLSTAATFLQRCREWSITILALPTAYWNQLTTEIVQENLTLPPAIRLVIIGGERAIPAQWQLWQHHVGTFPQLINGYGPTEATVAMTLGDISTLDAASYEREVPIGRPIQNTQVYLLDQNLQLVPVGVAGELHIGGVGLARGYLNRPELTAEKFILNPFSDVEGARLYKTGDLVRFSPDGTLEVIGRKDFQVKIRGFRIELGEIESILAQHPAIDQTIVVAREDSQGDKYLVAYVTPDTNGVTIDQLRQFLKQKLPDYMMPAAFMILKALPINAVGKVDRRALPDPDQINSNREETLVGPRDAVESKLVELWLQVLGKKTIGIRDRFFEDLGGSSLKAARLFLKIEAEFGKALPLAILYEAPTIEEIAKIIRQQEWKPTWSSLVPIQPQGEKLPLFCIHPGGGNVLCYRTLAPYLGADQPVYGLQSRGLDGKEEAIDSVQGMATNYLQEIKTVQATGPYLLAGYSFGGIVAYEIAQQLQQEGQEVAAVIFFDTISTSYAHQKTSVIKKLQLHTANLKKLSLSGQWGYFTHRWDLKIRATKFRLKALLYSLQGQPNPEAIAPHLLKLDDTNYEASLNYKTLPYEGKVVLFETIERPTDIPYDPSLGWRAFTQLKVIGDIPGHHGTMLEEPYVAFLGKKLKSYLEQFNPQ